MFYFYLFVFFSKYIIGSRTPRAGRGGNSRAQRLVGGLKNEIVLLLSFFPLCSFVISFDALTLDFVLQLPMLVLAHRLWVLST
jgi:hypothetical protein